MRIRNYNSVDHDIYIFDQPESLRLVGTLPPTPDEFALGLNRKQIVPVDYNKDGLWNNAENYGLVSPDWSGLHVRNRGSSLNVNQSPHHSYSKQLLLYQESAPYSDVLSWNYWNNESPPLILVSDRHFIGCAHFIGNTQDRQIRLLGKNGIFVARTGKFVSKFLDTHLYELYEPLTPSELTQVKAYDIVNPLTVPLSATFWVQGPNGSFNAYKNIGYRNVPPTLEEIHTDNSAFPNVTAAFAYPGTGVNLNQENDIWYGDSGSPVLVSYKEKDNPASEPVTYLYGASLGWEIYGQSNFWNWLSEEFTKAGVSKTLVNLDNLPDNLIVNDFNTDKKFKAGFLEEAQTSGMAFLIPPPNNPICTLKLCGPAELIKNAYVTNIIIDPLSTQAKFKCTVYSADSLDTLIDGELQFTPLNEEILESNTIHGVAVGHNNCVLTYTVRNKAYTTEDGANYTLSPFALEPYVGDVELYVNSYNNPVLDVDGNVPSFREGYNYQLGNQYIGQVPNLNMAAIAGEGLGREPCEITPEVAAEYITSINGILPNEAGAININGEDAACIAVDAGKGSNTHSIEISSHCPPCCRCSDYEAVQRYIRSYAAIYANIAKQYNEAAEAYKAIKEAFESEISCCESYDTINSRFKVWPQQNFAIQVQAMAENNKKTPLCMCKARLITTVTTVGHMSANETLEDGTILATYTKDSGSPLIITPMEEGSYLYFKAVNPGNQIKVKRDENSSNSIVVEVDFEGSDNPVPQTLPCTDPASIDSSNCMEPCDGYLMLTSAFTISDPIFRRIVNINGQGKEYTAEVNLNFNFQYTGGDPCTSCADWKTFKNINRKVKIAANRQSVNPCQPAKISSIEARPGDNNGPTRYYVKFSNTIRRVGLNGGSVTIEGKYFDPALNAYTNLEGYPKTVNSASNFEGSEIDLTDAGFYPTNIPSGASGIVITVSTTGAGYKSLCNAGGDVLVEVPVVPSSASFSQRLA